MTLNFVQQAIVKANTPVDIESEVDSLLDHARNKIGLFEATDEWLANNLNELPKVVDGLVTVMFTDSRGFNTIKKQTLSDSLWVITMKQLQYHLSVNYGLLSTAFANWVNGYVYREDNELGRRTFQRVTVTEDEMLPVAKKYLEAVKELGVVERNLSKKVVRLQVGNTITAKVHEMSEEFKAQLEELIEVLRERASMTCRPLAFKPNDWTDVKTGIATNANIKLISRNKLKNVKVSNNVLKAVNKLQSVKFVVAPCIIEAARDMLMNRALFSSKYKDYFKGKELNNEAFELYSEILNYGDKEMYFPVTMDQRGRMYYRGGLLSPQGVDFCKAAFQFAEFKPLGKDGFRALCMHTANACGQDKASINDRVQWVQDNWSDIMDVNSHRDIRKKFKGADVFQALVACKELQRLNKLFVDSWETLESNLVCHQDGTCNGLQHMAAITGDRPTAVAVNCVESTHSDNPADVYGIVGEAALKYVQDDKAAHDLMKKYGRDMAKNPVMVTSYGATETTIINNTADYLTRNGNTVAQAETIGKAYLEALSNVAGAVTQLTEAVSTRVQFAVAEGQKKFAWRTADGFLACTQYNDDEEQAVRVGLFYTRKRGMGKAPIDERKTAQAMAPNFVHSIDATHLRMVVNACDHELVTVHDSVGSHPSDFFKTAEEIRKQFVRVHTEYDALQDLCNAIGQDKPVFPRVGEYNVEEVLKSAYVFS